ncbi:MAG: hypothetical protein AAGA92_05465 [Planctomycetota bacterium]
MLARAGVEARVKRLALISPRWRECRTNSLAGFAGFLVAQGVLSSKHRRKISSFYKRASTVCHGDFQDRSRCVDLLYTARKIHTACDTATRRLLAGEVELG